MSAADPTMAMEPPGRMRALRQMLRALERAMPKNAMVSTDIGNICSVSNSYLRFDAPRSMLAAMSFDPRLIWDRAERPR